MAQPAAKRTSSAHAGTPKRNPHTPSAKQPRKVNRRMGRARISEVCVHWLPTERPPDADELKARVERVIAILLGARSCQEQR